MPKTPAEICADKVVAELKRLCPPAMVRISQEAYGDRGADIYVYVPRKFTDMLRKKLNDDTFNGAALSESVLARDWETPEEDAAWANL